MLPVDKRAADIQAEQRAGKQAVQAGQQADKQAERAVPQAADIRAGPAVLQVRELLQLRVQARVRELLPAQAEPEVLLRVFHSWSKMNDHQELTNHMIHNT